MRRAPSTLLLPLVAACMVLSCNGNIGDLFSAFPASAFAPDDPDDGNPTIPGAFEPTEVGFLASAQGVTGDVRNVATAALNDSTYAFLSAGPDGVHMVDITDAAAITASNYITTINDGVLSDAAASIAGGRVDDVTVLGNTYLVCLAVGSGAANAVTVFHIPTLVDQATSSSADLSTAFVPGTGNIGANGTPGGNAGGVSGASIAGLSVFLVASGDTTLGAAFIAAGTPGSWTAVTPATNPDIDHFLKVQFGLQSAYAVVAEDDALKIATITVSVTPSLGLTIDDERLDLTGSFATLDGAQGAAPGTFPATTTLDLTQTLYVSEQNAVRTFSAAAAGVPSETTNTIFSAGLNLSGLTADPGFLGISNGSDIDFYSNITGSFIRIGRFSAAGRRNYDLQIVSGTGGRFAIVAAEGNGMRVIQWSDQ